jgi:predicted GIY-YIG superfamily endonuclease
MPSQQDINEGHDIMVMVAPEGCKEVPADISSRPQFEQLSWKLEAIGKAPDHVRSLKGTQGLQAKRLQYGLKHRIASTIHGTLGQTLSSLVTSIASMTGDSRYRLWQREQIVVLLSRTKFAKDIVFVGSPKETARALSKCLDLKSEYTEYIGYLHSRMVASQATNEFPVINIRQHPYRPVDVEMPDDNSGYCYILLSLQDHQTIYIGQTMNLAHRLKQHNQGIGAKQTADPRLRPWALFGFVCGFDGNRALLKSFEKRWRNKRLTLRSASGAVAGPEEIAQLAHSVITDIADDTDALRHSFRYIQCGQLI